MSDALRHALNWFEIPVRDLARAEAFYGRLCDQPLRRESIGDATIAVFPNHGAAVGGCLYFNAAGPAPSQDGTLVYLNAEPSLNAVLGRVERAGGRIAQPPVALPGDLGTYAHFIDSEGNRVGLHARA